MPDRTRTNEKLPDYRPFLLRLRPDLREWVEQRATEQKVSMNKVVNDALAASATQK